MFNKYVCLFSSSSFLYSYPRLPCQTIGLTQDFWWGHKAGRRRCKTPQAHQGCPWIECREIWSMPTTFINISSRDLSIMVYRESYFMCFLFFFSLGGLHIWINFVWSRLVLHMTVFWAKVSETLLEYLYFVKHGIFQQNMQLCSVKILLLWV